MKTRLFVAAASVLVALNVQAKEGVNSDEVLDAPTVTKGRFFKKAVEDVQISGKSKDLSGRKEFLVPTFRVTYLLDSTYSNEVGGITSSKTKVNSTLEGVPDSTFQAITEAMYQAFLQSCREAGYQIGDSGANSGFAEYKMKKDYPYNKSGKVITLPAGTIAQEGFSIPAMKMLMADKEAALISVDLTVNFVINRRNEKKFTLGNKAAVETSQGITVGGSMSVSASKGNATVKLGQPVQSDIAFAEVDNATTKGDKAGDVIHGVGQWLGGGGLGNRKKTTRAAVNADPDRYAEAAKDALSTVNATFLDALNTITQ